MDTFWLSGHESYDKLSAQQIENEMPLAVVEPEFLQIID